MPVIDGIRWLDQTKGGCFSACCYMALQYLLKASAPRRESLERALNPNRDGCYLLEGGTYLLNCFGDCLAVEYRLGTSLDEYEAREAASPANGMAFHRAREAAVQVGLPVVQNWKPTVDDLLHLVSPSSLAIVGVRRSYAHANLVIGSIRRSGARYLVTKDPIRRPDEEPDYCENLFLHEADYFDRVNLDCPTGQELVIFVYPERTFASRWRRESYETVLISATSKAALAPIGQSPVQLS